jgi:hypothetical protein
MTQTLKVARPINCIHGIDSRFCATCNTPTKGAVGSNVSLDDVVRFLNEEKVRATYV